MGRVNTPQISKEERFELENLLKKSDNYTLRKRCQVVILKSEGRDSLDVGKIVDLKPHAVNNWVNRYKKYGIDGLTTVKGQGRKPVLTVIDKTSIKEAVQENRQRISVAKSEWEASTGKEVGASSFRRFLKSLVESTSAYEKD